MIKTKKKKGDKKRVLFVSKKGKGVREQSIEGLEIVLCKNLDVADEEWTDADSFSALVYCFDERKKLRKGEKDAKDPQSVRNALIRQDSKITAFMTKILRLRKDAFICILFNNPDNITAVRRTTLLQGGTRPIPFS